jgi:large subunit ribosomal protein L23
MKLSNVLVKPMLTEKVNKQTEKLNRYTFVVDRDANKLEIKKAVELFYNVKVENVNTLVAPGKNPFHQSRICERSKTCEKESNRYGCPR